MKYLKKFNFSTKYIFVILLLITRFNIIKILSYAVLKFFNQVGSDCRNDRKVPKMSINPYFSRALGSTQTIFTILAICSFLKFLRQFFQHKVTYVFIK